MTMQGKFLTTCLRLTPIELRKEVSMDKFKELHGMLDEMYLSMVLNRALKSVNAERIDEKEREHLDQIETVAMMAITSVREGDLNLERLESKLKKHVSGIMYDFRVKLKKHLKAKEMVRGK